MIERTLTVVVRGQWASWLYVLPDTNREESWIKVIFYVFFCFLKIEKIFVEISFVWHDLILINSSPHYVVNLWHAAPEREPTLLFSSGIRARYQYLQVYRVCFTAFFYPVSISVDVFTPSRILQCGKTHKSSNAIIFKIIFALYIYEVHLLRKPGFIAKENLTFHLLVQSTLKKHQPLQPNNLFMGILSFKAELI